MSEAMKERVPGIEASVASPVQECVCAFPYKGIETFDAQYPTTILETGNVFPEFVWCVPDKLYLLSALLAGFHRFSVVHLAPSVIGGAGVTSSVQG